MTPRIVTLPPDEPLASDGSKTGGWWHQSDDGQRVICDLCPRGCSLGDDDRSFCFVRQNRDGRIVSATYGRSTGFCIDPIEKKPLNQFYPGTPILSFGTAGCNLGCKFCQNWSISKSRQVDAGSEVASPETIARAAKELGCLSVAFTYNDPIVWAEYAIDTAKACHAMGIKTVAVTSGYITPLARKSFFEVMDAANVDLKGFSEDFYSRLTAGHLDPVLDTLRWLARESNVWLEITNLVIPGINDNADETARMCQWIVNELGPDVPLHFSAFHPDFHMLDRQPTPPETLNRAYDIARQAGLNYVYTGNLTDPQRQSTYCPGCKRRVIDRDGYTLGDAYHIRGGACTYCGTRIAGHFADRPGDWGSRRQPVRIDQYAQPATLSCAAPPPAPRQEQLSLAEAFPKPSLTDQQQQQVFRAAGARVIAAVCGRECEPLGPLLGDAATVPLYGAFVSLKRAGQLRSCCGCMGQSIPLREAIENAAVRAATDDPRFPPISPSELGHLDMEVWLLWGLQPMTARGEARVSAITIGKHGLQIARGDARGLLLPGVAVEHKLDARQFLEQVCRKAGLGPNDWKRDDTLLMTFEGYAIHGRLDVPAGPAEAESQTRPTPAEVAALAEFCRQNLLALYFGATPSFYLMGGFDGTVCGASLSVGLKGSPERISSSTYALRAEKPLQSTLYNLIESTAGALRKQAVDPAALRSLEVGLTVLSDAAMHGSADQADLSGFDPRRRALLVAGQRGSAWIYDPQKTAEQLLAEALQAAQVADPASTAVFSMAAASNVTRNAAAYLPQNGSGADVRPPAVAGMFYPGKPEEIARQLDVMFAERVTPEPWAAALVPHAGWVFSGRLAAATLSRVKIPGRVIVLCPKHRPGGVDWAVMPQQAWSLPGATVAADPELAQRLAGGVSGLKLDADAHRQEHAIEVQLPLLARLAPQSRVVGITIGGGGLPELRRFGKELAAVLRQLPDRPLLVVSSDMNHYANDQQTRRQDQLALEALHALDPERLYQTVLQHRISMCGMLPAVIVLEALRELDSLHRCQLVGYATSAEASGDTNRVVGYAGMLFA